MLANIFFVATGRTALVIISVLLVLFAAKKLRARGIVILFAGAIAGRRRRLDVIALFAQPHDRRLAGNSKLRGDRRDELVGRAHRILEEVDRLRSRGADYRSRHRLDACAVYKVRDRPDRSLPASATTNPHNQTFAVAIQLGLIGAVVLWAMWIAHLLLFRGSGLAEWIGLVVVVQNIVGSLFNSHLFDFVQGWVYVFGVGVAGGMVLKRRSQKANAGGAGPSA